MLEIEKVCYGLCTLTKQEVMGLELMRMDWPLPKRGKEPGTEANWFAMSLGMVTVYLKLVVVNE